MRAMVMKQRCIPAVLVEDVVEQVFDDYKRKEPDVVMVGLTQQELYLLSSIISAFDRRVLDVEIAVDSEEIEVEGYNSDALGEMLYDLHQLKMKIVRGL